MRFDHRESSGVVLRLLDVRRAEGGQKVANEPSQKILPLVIGFRAVRVVADVEHEIILFDEDLQHRVIRNNTRADVLAEVITVALVPLPSGLGVEVTKQLFQRLVALEGICVVASRRYRLSKGLACRVELEVEAVDVHGTVYILVLKHGTS